MQQLAMTMEVSERGLWTAKVVLPFTPPSKNNYDNWQPMWKSSAGKKWDRALREAYVEQQFPKAHSAAVAVQIWFASQRRRDWQNYVFPMMHWIADSLVHAGVIVDDTPDMFQAGVNGGLEFMVDKRNFVPAKQRQRTVIAYALRV